MLQASAELQAAQGAVKRASEEWQSARRVRHLVEGKPVDYRSQRPVRLRPAATRSAGPVYLNRALYGR